MQIEIADEFENPTVCQTMIVLQGSRVETIEQLRKILSQAIAGKPIQGVSIGADYVVQVITPVWNGEKY